MVTDNKLVEICIDIYKELYSKATPKADFNELRKTGEVKQKDFFMKYYLSQEEQAKIIEAHIKKNNLDFIDATQMRIALNMGHSPNTCMKTWEEARRN